MRFVQSVVFVVIAAACADRRPLHVAAVPATASPTVSATEAAPPVPPAPLAEATAAAPDRFQAEVKPLLMRRCTPCHAPGGRMYARMPFDDPATIVAHQEGILRRLKEADEHALVERWLGSKRPTPYPRGAVRP
jgi:hypothetical protein